MTYRPGPRIVLGLAIAMLLGIGIPPMVLTPLGSGTFFAALILGAFVGFLVTLFRRKVLLAVDDASGKLLVEDLRWPLATLHTALPLADIADADVVRDRSAIASNAVRVEIVLRSGTRVPVTSSYWGPGARHERVAAWLRTLCRPAGSNTT